jgi:tRNA (cmo5U34)-methyltransferase
MAMLLTLLPFAPSDAARVVELGCGEGRLSLAVMRAYPQAQVIALDGSVEMRTTASARLDPKRSQVLPFELASSDWLAHVEGADAIVSSLAIHHLDDAGKQRLFEAVAPRLTDRGALLIADLVAPQRPEARELFASTWDRSAQRQAATPAGFEQFQRTEWNLFRFPDPVDMPSPLFAQLQWLRAAGFVSVDCFWHRAGHAVYGGYRSATRQSPEVLRFTRALEVAESALTA